MPAEAAAALIPAGANVAMSGFTGAGYPKAVPGGAGRPDGGGKGGRRALSPSASGPARRPRPSSMGRSRRRMESSCGCHISPTPSPGRRSTPARWTTSTSTSPMWPRWSGRGSSGTLDVALVEIAGHHRGRPAHPLVFRREQQDVDRPGHAGDPGGQRLADAASSRACMTSTTARPCPRIAGRFRITHPGRPHRRALLPTARPTRWSPSCETDALTATRPFKPPDAVLRSSIAGHLLDFLSARGGRGRLPTQSPPDSIRCRKYRQRRAGRP